MGTTLRKFVLLAKVGNFNFGIRLSSDFDAASVQLFWANNQYIMVGFDTVTQSVSFMCHLKQEFRDSLQISLFSVDYSNYNVALLRDFDYNFPWKVGTVRSAVYRSHSRSYTMFL
jgi:hypothetical protein